MCVTMPNSVVDRSNLSGYVAIFYFSKWRSPAILDFEKCEILTFSTSRKADLRHTAKFRAVAEIWPFRFFKMAALRHLGFVIQLFGPSTKSIW